MSTRTRAETYAQLLDQLAEDHDDAVAVVFGGRQLTYAELREQSLIRAREMRALGLGHGDHFGILLPNSTELVELLFGGAMIGAVGVPINTRYKASELRHICTNGDLRTIFTTDVLDDVVDFKALLAEALPGLKEAADPWALEIATSPQLRSVVLTTATRVPGMIDAVTLREAAGRHPAPCAADAPGPADPFVIMYTSGTTANAKGCVTLNSSLVSNARAIAERFEVTPGDRWWDPLPMFHLGGVLLMTVVLTKGGTFVGMDHFDAGNAIDLIETHDVNVLYPLFPTITLSLMHHERFARLDQSSLRMIGNVGPEDIQLSIQKAFPEATLISAYGMTELCGSLAYSKLDDTFEQRTTSCGPLLPTWEARIVDPETGGEQPAGETGELAVRGPHLFAGYYGEPELTAASFDAEGYFHTGDLASFDTDGYLYFRGRLKDQLKVGGENVSAVEVESFLATHPAVKLAQIVGVPDDRYVEVPAAFVELVPGGSLTAEELIAYCEGQIASFKIPRHVRIVEEWPMSSTKIQKFRLRDQILAEL